MMPGIFTYANQDVLAGLVWAPGKPAGLFGRTPLALNWADRTALVPQEAEYLGKASLLSLLIGDLGEEAQSGRVLVAYAPLSGLQASPAEAVDDTAANDLAAPLSGLQASPAEAVDDPEDFDPVVDPAQGLFFAAVVVKGKPAIGAERLFDTSAELVAHIDVECSAGQIDRLATTPGLAKEIHSPIPVSLLNNPEPTATAAATATEATTRTVPTGTPGAAIIVEGKPASRLPVWQLATGGGISALALAAGALLLFPVQQSKPTAALPVAAVQITSRDEIAFGRNCLAAFAGVWPLAPGWQLVSEGCATPEMRDPNLEGHAGLAGFAPDHAVAYRIWHLRRGFDPAIARKAAEAVMATRTTRTGVPGAAARAVTAARATAIGSKITMVIQGKRMFSSIGIAMPMRNLGAGADQGAPLTPAALLAATEAVFLGLADSIVLQGGGPGGGNILSWGSTSGQPVGPIVRVTLNSGFAEIFTRMARIKGVEIARLNRSGKTVTLDITTRRIVTVPAGTPARTRAATRTRAAVPTDIAEEKTAVAPGALNRTGRTRPEPDRTPDMQEGGTL